MTSQQAALHANLAKFVHSMPFLQEPQKIAPHLETLGIDGFIDLSCKH